MKTEMYTREIEKQIEVHQFVQASNPPTSKKWLEASTEIHRLARLIIAARKAM